MPTEGGAYGVPPGDAGGTYPPAPLLPDVPLPGEPSGVEGTSGSLPGSWDLVEGTAGDCVFVGGVFRALSVGGWSVGSDEPGQIVRTATTPITRLTTAPAAISACRFVGFSPVSDANPPTSFGSMASGAGFSAGGAGLASAFASDFAGAAGFGPGIGGSFTGVSTAIGSIRGPTLLG